MTLFPHVGYILRPLNAYHLQSAATQLHLLENEYASIVVCTGDEFAGYFAGPQPSVKQIIAFSLNGPENIGCGFTIAPSDQAALKLYQQIQTVITQFARWMLFVWPMNFIDISR
jgi:hypothetical protein